MRNLWGFGTFKAAPSADVGFEDYIFNPGLSFLPMPINGTGIRTANPPSIASDTTLAINTNTLSGLPGILIPSFRTQPLSAQYPTG